MSLYTFQIEITSDYLLQCSLIDSKGNKQVIEIQENIKHYPVSIEFNQNEIQVCQQNHTSNNIYFMKEWLENPNYFKFYEIHFQGKKQFVIAEVLFALIIDVFKTAVEKNYILYNTHIVIPTDNALFIDRIQISLESIDLKGIILKDDIVGFDYQNQGLILHEILTKRNKYDKFKRKINKARTIISEEKKHLLDYDENQPFDDELITIISSRFTTKERVKLGLYSSDNYCVFIASRFFESIDDFINLEIGCKQYNGNLSKFFYNPISLKPHLLKFFPNIQTLHLYNRDDEYLENSNIQRYVNWYEYIPYSKLQNKNIEYKHVVYTSNCHRILYSEIFNNQLEEQQNNPNHSQEENKTQTFDFIIPNGVHILKIVLKIVKI